MGLYEQWHIDGDYSSCQGILNDLSRTEFPSGLLPRENPSYANLNSFYGNRRAAANFMLLIVLYGDNFSPKAIGE